ncbi:hypothetical protein ACR79P_08520 [Sphingobacterium spiritivorum]|uniref:hypothetical protein n=1 Tax=Sphingobacterium spiritivorum TaxID=258 RepID=UPI003DA3CCCE
MLLNLHCYIVFTEPSGKKYLEFDFVNAVEIQSSWRKLTSTGKITLPRKLNIPNGDINDIIKRGSKVSVWLGYNGELRLEYVGYVARIDAKVPFTIECEDEMWRLKQQTFSKAYRNASIKEIVSLIWPGKSNIIDFSIGQYRIDRASGAAVLDDLQKNYNVYSYFTYNNEPILNVSLGGYDFKKLSTRHVYNLMVNVAANDLIYRRKDENKMKVVATSTGKKGVVIRTEVGDAEGEEIKLDKKGMTITELNRLAQSELTRLQYDGYKGTITGFGIPYAEHNDIAVIQSPEYPERDGAYMIDEVVKTFDTSGYRRKITLGVKIQA